MLMAVPVCAAENPNTRGSNFFMASSVYLEHTTGQTFQVWFDVTAVGMMDQLGASKVIIQRSSDNASWVNVRTFSKDTYSSMVCTNTSIHASYVTYTGASGYYYRAYVELYAKDGSSTGSAGKYTSSIHF